MVRYEFIELLQIIVEVKLAQLHLGDGSFGQNAGVLPFFALIPRQLSFLAFSEYSFRFGELLVQLAKHLVCSCKLCSGFVVLLMQHTQPVRSLRWGQHLEAALV